MDQSLIALFDEVLSQVQTGVPKKILFRGDGTGGIASYVAGWMAGRGMDVIVLDGANRFNPYMASSFARKASIAPEGILKRIRIARAFTCYQMATLIGEKLPAFLKNAREDRQARRSWVILLGPLTTFLDEDVPEREAGPLFERTLRKVGKMAEEDVSFFLFQSPVSSSFKRAFLLKRLTQFSDLVWEITLEDQGPRVVLEKGVETLTLLRKTHQIPNTDIQIITNPQ